MRFIDPFTIKKYDSINFLSLSSGLDLLLEEDGEADIKQKALCISMKMRNGRVSVFMTNFPPLCSYSARDLV